MRWILVVSMAAALAAPSLAATDAQCTEILQHALNAGNPETRTQAVAALSLASGSGPLFDQLERMLQDKDVEVRIVVVASLADVKSSRATAALHKALDDAVPEVSFAAAKALWARHDPVGRAALLAVLGGESKTSSSFFSKEKRDGLRMMHTPRTTLMFAAKEGIGFAPVPGLGEGIASMQGSSRTPESRDAQRRLYCWVLTGIPPPSTRSGMRSPTRTGPCGPPRCIPSVCETTLH